MLKTDFRQALECKVDVFRVYADKSTERVRCGLWVDLDEEPRRLIRDISTDLFCLLDRHGAPLTYGIGKAVFNFAIELRGLAGHANFQWVDLPAWKKSMYEAFAEDLERLLAKFP
jgi:hypothetical protein